MRLFRLAFAAMLLPALAAPALAAKPYQPTIVTMKDVKARLAHGERLLPVDVRQPGTYMKEHADGAIDAPVGMLMVSAGMQPLPKDRWLLLYCTCPQEHGSLLAAETLHDQLGYTKLLVLKGGLDAWKQAGLKTAKGALPSGAATTHP